MRDFAGFGGFGVTLNIVNILRGGADTLRLHSKGWRLCVGVQDRSQEPGRPEGLPRAAAIKACEHRKMLDE
ncbi:hypothetical protein SRABI112_05407 [Pseudomonas mediterranea]|nr:hypothetical protein SRABI112_05407 [Pseudomonas mediterranea]